MHLLRTLIAAPVLSAVACSSAVAAAPAAAVPTHYYSFDTGSGTVAFDTGSVGGANATLTSATWSSNAPIAYAGNHSVSTSTTGIQAPGSLLAAQSTISLWAYWNGALATPQYLLDSGGSARTLVYFDSGSSPLVAYGGAFFGNAFTQPTTPGWQNIVLARNGNALKIYRNGTLQTTQALSSAAAIDPGGWFFGQRNTVTEHLDGQIDEYAFFNQELNASQVSALFASGTQALAVPEPGAWALFAVGAGWLTMRGRRLTSRAE